MGMMSNWLNDEELVSRNYPRFRNTHSFPSFAARFSLQLHPYPQKYWSTSQLSQATLFLTMVFSTFVQVLAQFFGGAASAHRVRLVLVGGSKKKWHDQ